MGSQWRRSMVTLASAGLLLAACSTTGQGDAVVQGGSLSSSEPSGPSGSALGPPSQDDAATLIEQALAARSANRLTEFADLVSAAGDVCPDPDAANRLGEVAVIAGRWTAALEAGRPKVQGVTERQLSSVDWNELAAACTAS